MQEVPDFDVDGTDILHDSQYDVDLLVDLP